MKTKNNIIVILTVIVVSTQGILVLPQSGDGSRLNVEWSLTLEEVRGFDYLSLVSDRVVAAIGTSNHDNTTLLITMINTDTGEIEESRSIKLGGVNTIVLCTATAGNTVIVGLASDYVLYKNITLIELASGGITTLGYMLLEPSVTPYSAYCGRDYLYVAGNVITSPKTRSPYIVKARITQGSLEKSSEATYSEYVNMTIIGITITGEGIVAPIRPLTGPKGELGAGSTILLLSDPTLEVSRKYDMGETATVVGVELDDQGNVVTYGYDVNARGKIMVLDRVSLQPSYTITLEAPSIITAVDMYDDLIVGAGSVILRDKTVPITLIYNTSTDVQPEIYTLDELEDAIVTSIAAVTPSEYLIAGTINGKAFMEKIRVLPTSTVSTTSQAQTDSGENAGSTIDTMILMLLISTIILGAIAVGLAFMLYKKRKTH